MTNKPIPAKSVRPPHHRTLMGIEQRARMKARIVNAALKVYAEKGPYGPVIDDFVKASGIARGTFYYYFPDVIKLREAAVISVTDQFSREAIEAMSAQTNPLIRLSIGIRLYLRRARKDRRFAEFVTSVSEFGSVLDTNARKDISAAIDGGLMQYCDLNTAMLVVIAVCHYAARYPGMRPPPQLQPAGFIRAVFSMWGVSNDLIDQALAAPLPRMKHRE